MQCPHCAGEVTLTAGEEEAPATPADVDIARINAERDVKLALIGSGVNPDAPSEPIAAPDTSHAEVYADAEVAVAAEEASAEVAAAEVVGAAIEGAAEVVAAAAEAAVEIVADGEGETDGALGDDAEVIVESTSEDEPVRGSLASRLFG